MVEFGFCFEAWIAVSPLEKKLREKIVTANLTSSSTTFFEI